MALVFLFFILFYNKYAMMIVERDIDYENKKFFLIAFCISLLISGCKKGKNNDKQTATISPSTNEVTTNPSPSIKIDDNQDWVYDANYSHPTDVDSCYASIDQSKLIEASSLIVPYININSDNASQANKQISDLYQQLIDHFNEYAKIGIQYNTVDYQYFINDHYLSLFITIATNGTDIPVNQYYTYNFNLEDGTYLSYQTANVFVGITNDSQAAQDAITNKLQSLYNDDDFTIYQEKSIQNYLNTVQSNSISYFIDQNKQLNIIVTLEIPAGRGQFDTIITL